MAAVARVVAAVGLVAAFDVTLFGIPSCSHLADASSAPVGRVYRLVAHNQYAEALPLALENRDRFPSDATTLWQLARVYEGLSRPLDEAAAWEAYLKQSPPTSVVCLRLSDLYSQMSRPSQVVALAERCLALEPRQSQLLADLAAARLALGEQRAAVDALRRGRAIDSTDPQLSQRLRALEEPR